MAECRFDWHVWEPRAQQRPGYEKVRVVCAVCGAGHTLEIATIGPGRREVDLTIFPAAGESTISREVIRWSITACAETIADMERDGIVVVRGDTTTLGRPVGM